MDSDLSKRAQSKKQQALLHSLTSKLTSTTTDADTANRAVKAFSKKIVYQNEKYYENFSRAQLLTVLEDRAEEFL